MALLLWCYDDICAHPPAGVRPKGFVDFLVFPKDFGWYPHPPTYTPSPYTPSPYTPCRKTGLGAFRPGPWARPSWGIWGVGSGLCDIWGGAGI